MQMLKGVPLAYSEDAIQSLERVDVFACVLLPWGVPDGFCNLVIEGTSLHLMAVWL